MRKHMYLVTGNEGSVRYRGLHPGNAFFAPTALEGARHSFGTFPVAGILVSGHLSFMAKRLWFYGVLWTLDIISFNANQNDAPHPTSQPLSFVIGWDTTSTFLL